MSQPKKVLIAITSNNDVFYDDGTRSGLFWSELSHPFHIFTKAGFEVEFASESGTFGLDEHSIGKPFISDEDLAEFKDPNSKVQKALASKLFKAKDVNSKDYGVFFAAGGHACLFDFPTSRQLQDIAEEVYQNGGIVSAVCHGPAILEDIHDRATGDLLVKGKNITSFSDEAEVALNLDTVLEKHKLTALEPFFKKEGAKYTAPGPDPLGSHAVTDGRLVTGANPASAIATAEQVVTAFGKLN